MKEDFETARDLAIGAGGILRRHFAQKTSVRWKKPGDPVTDADQEASRYIVQSLRHRFPADGILCEEEADSPDRLKASRVWIIDPMDGTAEFIAGRPEFAVMIGLAVDGRPQLGVVYLPIVETLYYAESGCGAFKEAHQSRQRLRVVPETNPGRATIAASRSHDSATSQQIRQDFGAGAVVHVGGVGTKVALICDGRADVYVHVGGGTNQWDTCAPEIILHEASGKMTDVSGRPLEYNTPDPENHHGVIASNGALHDSAVAAARRILTSER